jgi:hypothetical protein
MSEGCTRSHPHERMDCCCEHKTEIVRANKRIAEMEAELAEERSQTYPYWLRQKAETPQEQDDE